MTENVQNGLAEEFQQICDRADNKLNALGRAYNDEVNAWVDAHREEILAALRAREAQPAEQDNVQGIDKWVGCGECDPAFPCYNGEQFCFRLHEPGISAGERFAQQSSPTLPPKRNKSNDQWDAGIDSFAPMNEVIRYIPACEVTKAQREQVQNSELHKQGDMILIWVNEGDLYRMKLKKIK